MKNNLLSLLIIVSLLDFAYGKDISVFDAGNVDSQTPYGFTKAEKMNISNNEKITTLATKVDSISSAQNDKTNLLSVKVESLSLKQDELLQKIEGISTLFESDSKKINSTKNNFKSTETKLEEQDRILSNRIDVNTNKLDILDKKLDTFISLQKQNNKLLEEANLKLAAVVNKINSEYIKRVEFDELVLFVNNKNVDKTNVQPAVIKQDKPLSDIQVKDVAKKKNNKEILDEALGLSKVRQFTKALPLFEELLAEKYKVAEVSFYLGEIKLNKKLYKEAVQFYKQSMIADDKATYIPTLLLHTAYCFDSLKDKDNSMNFYKTIVDVYPGSDEAKEAAKKLKKQNPDDTKEVGQKTKKHKSDKIVDEKKKSKKEKKDDKK
ncbi:MAG: hypothetical protein HY307_02475 [Arcobacter sp.]|nr:hypothetical protein [Arcobacter sp.]